MAVSLVPGTQNLSSCLCRTFPCVAWRTPDDLQVDDRDAREHAGAEHRLDALLDARDVFLRHVAADDLAVEFEAGPRRKRLQHDLNLRILAGAAGLLLVGVVLGDRAGDLFAI